MYELFPYTDSSTDLFNKRQAKNKKSELKNDYCMLQNICSALIKYALRTLVMGTAKLHTHLTRTGMRKKVIRHAVGEHLFDHSLAHICCQGLRNSL